MASNSSEETLNKALFEHIKNGKWEQVVELHKDHRAFKMKIASSYSGDTALLLAISEEREDIVKKLVELITSDESKASEAKDIITSDESKASEAKDILRFHNEKQRTALHAAAATGSTEMCKIIATIDKSLVFDRDYKGETPLYRAVRYGRTEAFLYLHSIAVEQHDQSFGSKSYCWNDDDQTILHNAIIRENFDLAFQIIHLNKELVNLVDKEGESPLHALARKPAAFESGSSFRGRNRMIYDCLPVETLKIKEVEHSNPKRGLRLDMRNPSLPPENKQSFLDFVRLLFRNAVLGGSHHGKKGGENVDIESRHGHVDHTGANASKESQSLSQKSFFVEHVSRAIPVILGYGDMSMIKKIREEKEKHVCATQVLEELLNGASLCDGKRALTASERLHEEKMSSGKNVTSEDSRTQASKEKVEDNASKPGSKMISEAQPVGSTSATVTIPGTAEKKESPGNEIKKETAILVAAKYGVAEIIQKVLEHFPMAIYDKDKDSKNIVLVALENRHLKVLKFLLNKYKRDHIAFQKVDEKGNTALHYAAMYDEERVRPWPVPGAALQMQWEIKWHEFVENVMPPRLYLRTNKEGQTPKEMFSYTHKGLVKNGGDWLMSTATSCSVVATLIATVAFASSTTAPGGTDSDGKHSVKRNPTFELFAISSLVSLCFSVTSLIMFLAILTSRHQEKDFGKELPRKILFGLTSLFVSIASVLVTFCAGHFLIFKDNFKYAVFPVYAVTLLPLCLFAAAQFPLYFDLLLATFWNPFNN